MSYLAIADFPNLTVRIEGSPGGILAFLLNISPDLYFPLQHMHGIRSQVGLHQACGLILLARQFKGQKAAILNVGCAFGYSTACLAEGAPDADIVSLDVNPKRLEMAEDVLSRYKKVRLVKMVSWDYLNTFKERRWDMIFVDGCHREIWRDMPFYNQVRPGGLFLSHDYIPARFPFVVEALDSLTKQFDRPFDVRIYDNRQCGVVGMVRRKDEIWQMPRSRIWTEEKVQEWVKELQRA
jgi:SAM-dependent methyltransferase